MAHPKKRSALERYFNDFVPQLSDYICDDDPTLDLDLMFMGPKRVAAPVAVTAAAANATVTATAPASVNSIGSDKTLCVSKKRDLSMEELRLIVGKLKDGGTYAEKLISIMLRGLQKDLEDLYNLFVERGLPDFWLPIVKMNDDNIPYVEFLHKSHLSDEDPCSQLRDFTPEHMALSKYVLNRLQERATRRNTQPAVTAGGHEQQSQQKSSRPQTNQPKPRAVCNGPAKQQCHSLTAPPKPKLTTDKENLRKSLPTPMVCSTPIAQRNRAAAVATTTKRTSQSSSGSSRSLNDTLNDSKRIPPPRACKSGSSGGSYSRYF